MFYRQIDEQTKLVLPMPYHAEEIAALVRENLPYLQKWMAWATDDYSIESTRAYIKSNLQNLADGAGFAAGIAVENKIVGQIGFHNLDQSNKSVMMGYWLAEKMQGGGIVTKCCRVFIDYAFDELELNRVQINCNVENQKSRRIPERLGFQLEGVHRQVEFLRDRLNDWAIYALLAADYAETRT